MHVAVCREDPTLYPTLYHLPQKYGPSALRFPIRRSNSERFLGAFVASQFTGMIFTIFIAAGMGVVLAFLLEDWPGSSALKSVQTACFTCLAFLGLYTDIYGKPVRVPRALLDAS